MQLTEMTNQQFIDLLASAAPAPGGGSAAALAGAQGCALGAMVCALSIGKTKYAEFEELDKATQEKLLELKDAFLKAMDEDTATFGVMTKVFAMPKGTDEEKAARRAAMQEALKVCTKIPFTMLGFCVEALKNINAIVGKSNQSAASDLGVAAVSLSAAVRGAWLNVLINIGGIKDTEFVQDKKDQGAALVTEAEKLAENIYKNIVEEL